MPRRLFLKYAGVLFLIIGCFGFSNAAWAGFQWVAPADVAPVMPQPNDVTTLAPAPSVVPVSPLSSSGLAASDAESVAPVIIEGTNPVPLTPSAQAAGAGEIPVYKGPTPEILPAKPELPQAKNNAPAPVAEKTALPAPDGDVVHGFAKSVPLAVALRQILPAGYAFSIDQGVDMGTIVSFQGGRGWRETLRAMLAPVGLVMRERGQMVSIGFVSANSAGTAMQPVLVYPMVQADMAPQVLVAPTVKPLVMAPSSSPATVNGPWTAEHGGTLRKALEDWCHRAHVDLDWLAEYDYPLQASVRFDGTFEEAVRDLLIGFEGAHPQPVAELHSNPRAGQIVLVIQARGNTNSD
jgi:hypothetical protein